MRSMTHVDAVAIEGVADLSDEQVTLLASVREFVVSIGAPRSDHRQREYPAVAKLNPIGGGVATTDLDGV